MLTVPAGSEAVLEIPFADDEGNAITPISASYQVLDGTGAVLVTPTAIGSVSGPNTQITISGGINTAPGARSVMLSMVTATGTIVAETIYGVVNLVRLQFLSNSFQTYAQASFLARDLPNIAAFAAADKDDQSVALIEAFRRMILMNYYIPWPEFVDVMNYLNPRYAWHITPRMWPQMTAALYAQYPAPFHLAMQQAQVVEANAILTGDPVGDKMRAGLLAWSVGESKMMFKSGVNPLQGQVSRATMNYLKGWLDNKYTITRS